MTRERAARIITIILDCCKGKEEDYEEHEIIPLEESFKALGMAIEALEQQPVLDKIRAEIEQIEINGYIRDIECFRAGIDTALNVINKYKMGSEE